MRITYKDWNPRAATFRLIEIGNEIIEEYDRQGYTLTLRQLYYQFVARDIIPNTERSYKNLVNTITKARLAGMMSWEAIEDRNREHHNYWYDEEELNAIRDLPGYIQFDQWQRQENYVEVWVEKEALGSVVVRACRPYLVPYMSCKGYLSSSEAWRAGRRFKEQLDAGKNCYLLHLGDHDPSGIDMTRDNADRLELFTEYDVFVGVEVRRLALNMDQVDEYKPPPNPTKVTDSRAKEYLKKYGATSWELDALRPSVIENLIVDEIKTHIDFGEWQKVNAEQEEKKDILRELYKQWPAVQELLNADKG